MSLIVTLSPFSALAVIPALIHANEEGLVIFLNNYYKR